MLSKKPLVQRAEAVRRSGGAPFLTLRQSDFFQDLTPWGKLNHKTISEHLHFGLCVKDHLPSLPHNHTIQFIEECSWPGANKRECLSLITPQAEGCEWHIATALAPTEGWWKWKKWKNHYTMIWKHRAWATCGIHHNGLRMASQPKEIRFKL